MTEVNSEKRKAAIDRLQDRWILHKAYDRKKNPAHSFPESLIMYQIRAKAILNGRIV